MGKLVGSILQIVASIYFAVSVFIFVPYYNWQYAKQHGFSDWLFLGEVVASAKALVWPYYTFIDNGSRDKEVKTQEASFPDVLPSTALDQYVSDLNKQVPMRGPDGTGIVGASRSGSTVTYTMHTLDNITHEELSLMNAQKNNICKQEAEMFFLSRGVGLSWKYHNSQMVYVGTISITPEECE